MTNEDNRAPFTTYVTPSFSPSVSVVTQSPSKRSFIPGSSELNDILKSKDEKKIKHFVRENHWPFSHEIRQSLWWKLYGTVHGKQIQVYADVVADFLGQDSRDQIIPLPSFVHSGHLESYHLSEEGVLITRRLLSIIANERPDIVYCPVLFSLVSILLHYMSEEECYYYVGAMVRSRERYFAQTRAAYEAWPLVLLDLTQKYAKSSVQTMIKRGIHPEIVFSNWTWWIFKRLPFAYLVRILDCFLFEGLKFLYRIALAILLHYFKTAPKESYRSDTDCVRSIEEFCTEIPVSVSKLFKTAFGLRGLSRKSLWKLTLKKELYVQSKHNVAMLQATLPVSPSTGSFNHVIRDSAGSQIVSRNQWRDIYGWIPKRFTLKQPTLLFSTAEHGTSLSTFYNRVEGHEPTFIAIKTKKSEVIGAYCSTDWAERRSQQRTLKYFGTGESFVCKLLPAPCRHYPWVGITLGEKTPNTAHLFMCGDTSQINLGGGSGIAIMLDENLLRGSSERCDTYDNSPLADGGFFDVTILEVFSFD